MNIHTTPHSDLPSPSAMKMPYPTEHTPSPPFYSTITQVLSFWFGSSSPLALWFGGSRADDFTASPSSTLVLILLLDQFPRNIYRGTAEAFASDAKALEVAEAAVARGDDLEMPLGWQLCFYVPFMHSETVEGQRMAVECMQELVGRCERVVTGEELTGKVAKLGREAAAKHEAVIERFGRFPARNEALGRKLAVEERAFLEEHLEGF